jgi:hypothetical protein
MTLHIERTRPARPALASCQLNDREACAARPPRRCTAYPAIRALHRRAPQLPRSKVASAVRLSVMRTEWFTRHGAVPSTAARRRWRQRRALFTRAIERIAPGWKGGTTCQSRRSRVQMSPSARSCGRAGRNHLGASLPNRSRLRGACCDLTRVNFPSARAAQHGSRSGIS